MGSFTPIRNFYKPDIGETGWGNLINDIFDEIDGDINVEGKVKIWPSGGISFANNSGDHSDPGNDAAIFKQSIVTILNYLDVSNLAEFYGDTYIFGNLYIPIKTADVSDPIELSEIEAEFGTPNSGAIGVIYDSADDNVWLVVRAGGTWWYEQLTEA